MLTHPELARSLPSPPTAPSPTRRPVHSRSTGQCLLYALRPLSPGAPSLSSGLQQPELPPRPRSLAIQGHKARSEPDPRRAVWVSWLGWREGPGRLQPGRDRPPGALPVRAQTGVCHYRVSTAADGSLYLQKDRLFPSLEELLAYYKANWKRTQNPLLQPCVPQVGPPPRLPGCCLPSLRHCSACDQLAQPDPGSCLGPDEAWSTRGPRASSPPRLGPCPCPGVTLCLWGGVAGACRMPACPAQFCSRAVGRAGRGLGRCPPQRSPRQCGGCGRRCLSGGAVPPCPRGSLGISVTVLGELTCRGAARPSGSSGLLMTAWTGAETSVCGPMPVGAKVPLRSGNN